MAGRRRTFLSAVLAHHLVGTARAIVDVKHVQLHQSGRPIKITLPAAWQVTTDQAGSVGITQIPGTVNNVWQIRGLLPIATAKINFINPGPGFAVSITVTVVM